jgi:hypothetical protein
MGTVRGGRLEHGTNRFAAESTSPEVSVSLEEEHLAEAVLAQKDRTLVADAGNSILSVDRDGTVPLFAVFPNITDGLCAGLPNDEGTTGCDFVPTSLAEGPDGAIYVGALGPRRPGRVAW